ncbi:MAG TPA: folylpolyglutamate synthase/dihydrofolate synthase family protein, partial [Candidatus Thermoplasmatota archaeon]|nr:folylpolyglutamate synthase/dihydrofolate synthase family protein [Candidatus Thermoplasmatota archaeon]
MWSYEEALGWLYGRQALGIKLGLAKVERLLAAVGDPHTAYRAVHVAGTNGKGSVARMVARTLQNAGRRVGCTTSPHLVSFTERIEVDGEPIARGDVARLLARLRPAVELQDRQGEPPTFFEVVTALAFLAFREAEVEWAVVETGMGGRLDATNVLRPALTVITNVDLDHQEHLGHTVAEIAWEKSGIMKPGVPCVTGASGDALTVLKARSHELEVPMSIVGEDYHVVPGGDGLVLLRPTGESHYAVGLAGEHQRHNAALVVAATEALRSRGVAIPPSALEAALRETTNPGRLETFEVPAATLAPGTGSRPVTVLLDGAHNVAAARALRSHLDRAGWQGFHLVTGFCADKDWTEALAAWLPCAGRVWAVPLRNPRSLDPRRIVEATRPSGVTASEQPDVRSALACAAAAGAERILVAGSLYLAGEARALLTGAGLEEIRGTQ